ncbi:MAG: hypothetical protein CME60_02315 [Halobacteriovoraceae bacterium]|nr:hypothetical protein [Halobacteriovoraceae bacterium]
MKNTGMGYLGMILIMIVTSCVDQNAKLAGDFALSGFDFDVEAPIASLNSSHSPYVNSTTIQLDIDTGKKLINCASFDRFAITETDDEPSSQAFRYTCQSEGTQTISYTFKDATEGDRTLYLWSIDDRAQKKSTYSEVDLILDTIAPTGSISLVNDYIQGGSTHTLSLSSSDNIELIESRLEATHYNSGVWEDITYNEGFFSTSVSFPIIDSSGSRLRYLLTDAAGNTTEILSNTFIIDSTTPTLSITNPSLFIAGGSTYNINYSAYDLNGIASWNLSYSQDNGSSFAPVQSSPSSPYAWNVPLDDTNDARIRLSAADVAGNAIYTVSTVFTVDSTPPAITLDNPPTWLQGGSTYNINFSASDHNGISSLNLEYSPDGITYSSLTTLNSSPFSWSVPVVDIPVNARLRLTAVDPAGNSSVLATTAFGIDSTNPSVSLDNMAAIIRGGINNNISLSSSDSASGIASANLYYSNDSGSSYSLITTFPANPTYSWSTPAVDLETARLRYIVTDNVGNSTTVENNVFEIDSTAPATSLDNPPSILKGGDNLAINLSASDKNGLATYNLEYAADGTNFSLITSSPVSPYTWTIPLDDVPAAKIRIVAIDPVGNQTLTESSAFEVDSTSPAAPPIALNSNQYTNVTAVSFTMSACNEHYNDILINTGSAPAESDPTWQTCSTGTGAITYTLPTTEGPHTLSAWSKDDAGNISASSTDFTIYYDVTSPVINVSNPGLLAGSNTYTINWNLTETYIDNTRSFDVDYWNGSSWQNIANFAATTGPHSSQGYSTSWTTPNLDRTDIRLRVQVLDLAGNSESSESTQFEIDSTPPNLTISSPAANSYHKASVVMTGLCETGVPIFFSGALQEDFSVTCSGGSYSQTLNFSNGDGNKLIYASQTDAAGNNTLVSRTFIRDEVAPVLSLTSGTNPDFTNANQPNTWSGTCEGNYSITITGDQSTTIPCSSGSWSWTAGSKTSDGNYSYSLTQTDAAGNTTNPALSLSWERDATPPVFNMSAPITIEVGETKTDINNKDSIDFSGACEGTNVINISGAQSAAISCSASSWTWSTATASTDGMRNYTFTQSDSAGNAVSFTYRWDRDTTGPALFVDENLIKSNTNTVTFTGTCETGITINISGADSSSVSCPSGTWSYTTATRTGDATRNYNFSQQFPSGAMVTTTVSGQWIRETNAPTISSYSTSASSPSRKPFIPVDLTATSQNSNVYIKKICFKSGSSVQPAADDKCWLEVDSPSVGHPLSQTLNLANYNILLGWEPMLYNSYAFVMDEAGNISTNTSSVGTDRLQITYDPGIAPELFDVLAASNPSTAIPPTRGQSQVAPGSDVFIRWKITDNYSLPSGAISLYYTTDDIVFNAITGAEALNQNTDYGCGITLDANEGCFKWTGGSPVSVAYKVQVSVTDTTDITVQQTTNILNSGQLKIIAGNTDNGIGGSAQTATFSIEGDTDDYDGHSIIFTEAGDMYYMDPDRGILTVDESDGSLIVFIPRTGTSSGDGGPAKAATLNNPIAITLDYQGRMLIHDYNRIRRVDLTLSEPNIETIIGGGSNKSDTVSNPLDVEFDNPCVGCREEDGMSFFAMPNGNIVFWSERPRHNRGATMPRVRIYNNATGQVTSKYFSGNGDWKSASQDISKCYLYLFGIGFDSNSDFNYVLGMSQHRTNYPGCDDAENEYRMKFDPETFAAVTPDNGSYSHYTHYPYTGMDGNLYQIISRNYVMKLDPDTGSWTRVLGSGTRGECIDGELATDCNMHIMNLYVSPTGKFYFGDRGSVRTVNDDGEVITIFGQKRTFGDGVLAINARFDLPKFVDKSSGTDRYIVGDNSGNYVKEFTVEGNINVIAGNGNHAVIDITQPAKGNTITYSDHMAVDPANGNLYMARNHSYGDIYMLNRGTGNWTQVIGDIDSSGTNYWDSADGLVGSAINSHTQYSRGRIIGFGDNKIAMVRFQYNYTDLRHQDSMFKLYNRGDSYRQSHMMGIMGWPSDNNTRRFCTAASTSTTASTCEVPTTNDTVGNIQYDPVDDKWIMAIVIGGTQQDVYYYYENTDTIEHVAYVGQDMENWYKHVRDGGVEKLYYCSTSGRIRVHNLDTDNDEGHLAWPMSNLRCMGRNAAYNAANHSIVFTFEQNGLYGVAEYFIP